MNRRDFLQTSGLAAASLLLPRFLRATSLSGLEQRGKVLVVIQLTGGNDGLNTVVPYGDDLYHALRPGIGLETASLHRITDHLGFHPELSALRRLYDDGHLAILNNVGYPEPNRSHFRSMDIWHSASAATDYLESGWIGRHLDGMGELAKPYHAIEVDDTLSLAMKGERHHGIALTKPGDFYRNTHEPFFHAIAGQPHAGDHHHRTVDYLHQTLVDTTHSAAYLYEKSKIYRSQVSYPGHPLARHLKLIAELIVSGSETQVYYASLAGFDTHVGQKGKQARLLGQYAGALEAFVSDLKQNNRFEDVCILTFSEFGRRVAQNASGGTDHGTASNVFLAGGALKKAGFINEAPDLSDLDEGDLKFSVDFRRIYADLLSNWLGGDATRVLGKPFEPLGVV